jgi:hypothetical protein
MALSHAPSQTPPPAGDPLLFMVKLAVVRPVY